MAKSDLRLIARQMRSNGEGIKTIARKITVSPSTVSNWCKDIVLTSEQIKELERRARDPYYGQRLAYSKKQQAERKRKTEFIMNTAKKESNKISKKSLFFAGVSLYWAEGFKKDKLVGFSNSDPAMIKFFLFWLKECCDIDVDRITVRLGLNEQYEDRVDEIELYWKNYLQIPKEKFKKPFFQKVAWKKIYDHPEDYHGVLRVRVTKSTDLLRKFLGWIEGMKESVA